MSYCVAIIDLLCHIVGYVFDSCGIFEARGANLRWELPECVSDNHQEAHIRLTRNLPAEILSSSQDTNHIHA